MIFKIKSWVNGKVLHTIEADSIKLAVEALVRQGKSLNGANLSRAILYGADLIGANLYGANLYGANLYGANLIGAYLYGANLSRANLNGAEISDLLCLSELSDAIDLAPMIFQEWEKNGFDAAKKRFGLYQVYGEAKALIAMAPLLVGGFCFVLHRREIWFWSWSCPNQDTVPILWRDPEGPSGQAAQAYVSERGFGRHRSPGEERWQPRYA